MATNSPAPSPAPSPPALKRLPALPPSPPPPQAAHFDWFKAAKPLLFVLALVPFVVLVWDGFHDRLTADPIKEITHRTGWWTLTLLLVTLSITPLRRLTGWNRIVKLRRMIGLFAFFYACLHVLTYFGLDQMFVLSYLTEDIVERPYITVGFTAWLLLIPLAVTSTAGWVRRLGKRWQRLHQLIYVTATLGVIHFYWSVKADVREPLVFAAILAALLAARLLFRIRKKAHKPTPRPPRPATLITKP